MTPRELLNRKKKSCLLAVGLTFLAVAAVAYSESWLPASLYAYLAAGSVTVFTVSVLYVYLGIKCPKCGKILGLKFVFAEETLTRCPRCGVDFDRDSLGEAAP